MIYLGGMDGMVDLFPQRVLRGEGGMRVLIDIRPSSSPTGIGRYSRLLASIAHTIPRHHCWTLGSSEIGADLRFDSASRIEEELHLPALLDRESIDVMHSPLFQLPACLPCRGVITIHDAIPAVRPELSTPGFSRLFEEAHEAAQWADRVVCPSEHARADVVRALGVPAERVVVVPECPDPAFRPSTDEEEAAIRSRVGLDGAFFLVVGSIERRKNPGLVLDALAATKGVSVVFAGPRAGFDLANEAKRRGLTGRVRALGLVPDQDLVALYGAAEALVFPSLYEGFGLPVVEAFACGTPVLCSRAASLPEVAGDAAILFDPEDARSLAAAIEELRGSEERRADLVARGRERLRVFSPEAVGEGLAALYDELEASASIVPIPLTASGGRA